MQHADGKGAAQCEGPHSKECPVAARRACVEGVVVDCSLLNINLKCDCAKLVALQRGAASQFCRVNGLQIFLNFTLFAT